MSPLIIKLTNERNRKNEKRYISPLSVTSPVPFETSFQRSRDSRNRNKKLFYIKNKSSFKLSHGLDVCPKFLLLVWFFDKIFPFGVHSAVIIETLHLRFRSNTIVIILI